MKTPIFIRPLTEDEQHQVQAGLRSSDAFVMRRCQILRASARGERVPAIAHQLGCDDQTVRNVIHEFNAAGLMVLQEGSSRPHRLHTSFSQDGLVRLKDLLHRSPRDFGKERGRWTLELAAQVSFEQGLIATPISDESVRRALKRLKTNWKRAKHWITSPDPQYLLKKTLATGCSPGPVRSRTGPLAISTRCGGVALLCRACTPGRTMLIPCGWWSSPGTRETPTPKRWRAMACCGSTGQQMSRFAIRCRCVLSRGAP